MSLNDNFAKELIENRKEDVTRASLMSQAAYTKFDKGATTGEVRRLDIPAAEAYADKGFADWDIPPGADLIFQIEVLAVA